MSLYGSNKAAINLLTKSWAAEYGPSGVRINTVSPGPTRTEGTESMGEGLEQLAAQAPARRPGTAEKLRRRLSSWRRIIRASFMGQDSPSTAAAPRFEIHGGKQCLA